MLSSVTETNSRFSKFKSTSFLAKLQKFHNTLFIRTMTGNFTNNFTNDFHVSGRTLEKKQSHINGNEKKD